MKKVIVMIIAAATLLGLAAGCDSEPSGSNLTAEEILGNFEAMLEPIADQFQMVWLAKVELEDGSFCQPAVITDTASLSGRSYHLSVFYFPESGAHTVSLTGETTNRAEINFALLSCYLYKSLNLPEIEAQAFYDHFNMLTEKPEGSMTTEGWDLSAISTEGLLSFAALYKTE